MNNRRKLITALSAVALEWTGAVRAQMPAKGRRIGLLSSYFPSDSALWYQAFRLGLRQHGWVEGKNIRIEYRYAEGMRDRVPQLVTELIRLDVEVIVASLAGEAAAAQKASTTIPIVVAAAGDPVASGLAESLARPGSNVTGLSQMMLDLIGKRLELLKEMVPNLSRVAVLWRPGGTGQGATLSRKELQLPARQLGLQLHSLEVSRPGDFDKAFDDAISARAGALFVLAAPFIVTNLKQIAILAAKSRLASIFKWSEFADAGGLMAYGPDRADMYRRAATFVDKILRGTKPAAIPFEQPTKFELVINAKIAKALGITIPQTILVRADRIIE